MRKIKDGWAEVDVVDWKRYRESGKDNLLGRAFIFQKEPEGIYFLLGKEVEVDGLKCKGPELPEVTSVAVWTPKALYRPDDLIYIGLAEARTNGTRTRKIMIEKAGEEVYQASVSLDEGMAIHTLKGLSDGVYKVKVEGAEKIAFCSFEVAEYQRAPLEAKMVRQERVAKENELNIQLRLRSFEIPLANSKVKVDLMRDDQATDQSLELSTDEEGLTEEGSIKLEGEGNFTLNVQVLDEPEKTASVWLKGTREIERKETKISSLETQYLVSMVSSPGAQEVRRLYLSSQKGKETPFDALEIIGKFLEIKAKEKALVQVVIVDPETGISKEYKPKKVNKGESFRIKLNFPWQVVYLGAWLGKGKEKRAWEGCLMPLRPSSLSLNLNLPEKAKPGETVDIELETGLDREIPVALLIKDQRLITTSDPQTGLARSIKQGMVDYQPWLDLDEVHERPYIHVPMIEEVRAGVSFRGTRGWTSASKDLVMSATTSTVVKSLKLTTVAAVKEVFVPQVEFAEDSLPQVDLLEEPKVLEEPEEIREEEAEIVFYEIIKVKGKKRVPISMSQVMSNYTVEAFALDQVQGDWVQKETSILVTKDVYGKMELPPFVHPDDFIFKEIEVSCKNRLFSIELYRDGNPVLIYLDNELIKAGEWIAKDKAKISFQVLPGTYQLIVKDAITEEKDVSEQKVDELGKLTYKVIHRQFPEKGDLISTNGLSNLRVEPGLKNVLEEIAEAVELYGYECCVQTSAKLIGGVIDYLMCNGGNGNASRQSRALAIALACLKREESMETLEGLRLYPEQKGLADPDWARHAVQNLCSLRMLAKTGNGFSKEITEIIERGAALGERMAELKKYGVNLRPKKASTPFEALCILSNGASPQERNQAIHFLISQIKEEDGRVFVPGEGDLFDNDIARRTATARTAEGLILGGETQKALKLANSLFAEMNTSPEPSPFTPTDKAEAVALLRMFQEKGIAGGKARIKINGKEISFEEALALETGSIQSIEVLEGVACVRYEKEITEDWAAVKSTIPIEVYIAENGRKIDSVRVGQSGIELIVRLKEGYFQGALACLLFAPSLTPVKGGGQVLRRELDFAGEDQLRVPLTGLSPTLDEVGSPSFHHFAVLVRNMFEEKEVGSTGFLTVRVTQ